MQFVVKGALIYQPDNMAYTVDDKFSVNGCIHRLDNFMAQFEGRIIGAEAARAKELAELEKAKTELLKPFPQQRMLELLRMSAM